jgi:transketolase
MAPTTKTTKLTTMTPKSRPSGDLDTICVNTIRTLAIDAVEKANSGHPGTPMGMAPVGYQLWQRQLRFDPAYETVGRVSVTLDDLKSFRELGSRCPGHPEYRWTSGVEATTGPLGQGVANSVGMAIASRWLAERYNRPDFELFDFDVYALMGAGCMMEGISATRRRRSRGTLGSPSCAGSTTTTTSPSKATPHSPSARTWGRSSPATAGT